MQRDDIQVGQRIRINLPGMGDHGQIGTVRKVRGNVCSIHLDWDRRPTHLVVFYPADLVLLPDDTLVPAALDGNALGVPAA